MGDEKLKIDGAWSLEVSTPFGSYPAKLHIERADDDGGDLKGRIDSRLGIAPLSDINPTEEGFEATVSLEIRGSMYEARVNATIADERIEGAIRVKLPFAPPARFKGSRDG